MERITAVMTLAVMTGLPVVLMYIPLNPSNAARKRAVRGGLLTALIVPLVAVPTVILTVLALDEPANPGNNYSAAQVVAICGGGLVIVVLGTLAARYPVRGAVAASMTFTFTAAATWIAGPGNEDTTGLYLIGAMMAVYPTAVISTIVTQTVASLRLRRVQPKPAPIAGPFPG